MMLSRDKKREITEVIVKSNTFKNAPTSIALLRYLVQADIEDRPLKESIIDIDFFGGNVDTDNNNPRVRVNIYNLRKKLKAYYESDGVNETIRIIIDKGQYSVRFEKQPPVIKKNKKLSIQRILPYLLFFSTLIILLILQLPKAPPKLWNDFFTNQHATNLFIGDAFGYGGKTISGLNGWTRDFDINSIDEYYEMLEKNPELKLITTPTDFNYSTRMAENATHDFTHFFTLWGKNFEIKYATKTSFVDIKEGNTIYVGRLKDQKNFIYLFNEANEYFKIQNNQVQFSGHNQLPDTTFITNTNYTESDYALVSKVPGPNNTEQFFFFSNHDIGVMATVEYFTNPDSIKSFSTKYLNNGVYFTAFYKAKGKERINLSLEEILVVPFQ